MMMEGRGEILSPVAVSLEGLTMVVLYPDIHISTAVAYAEVEPAIPNEHLRDLISSPIEHWKKWIVNDFEPGIFRTYPELGQIKQELYNLGAIYASLSGSGSSLYGIFREVPELPEHLTRYLVWQGEAGQAAAI